MEKPDSQEIDLIDEFRLRRWARENYVPVENRDDAWHGIVLDEMTSIDLENQTVSWHEPAQQRSIPGTGEPIRSDIKSARPGLRVLNVDPMLETA